MNSSIKRRLNALTIPDKTVAWLRFYVHPSWDAEEQRNRLTAFRAEHGLPEVANPDLQACAERAGSGLYFPDLGEMFAEIARKGRRIGDGQ